MIYNVFPSNRLRKCLWWILHSFPGSTSRRKPVSLHQPRKLFSVKSTRYFYFWRKWSRTSSLLHSGLPPFKTPLLISSPPSLRGSLHPIFFLNKYDLISFGTNRRRPLLRKVDHHVLCPGQSSSTQEDADHSTPCLVFTTTTFSISTPYLQKR